MNYKPSQIVWHLKINEHVFAIHTGDHEGYYLNKRSNFLRLKYGHLLNHSTDWFE